MSRQQEEQIESDSGSTDGPEKWMQEGAPYIDVELLTPNEYSRPQIPISSVQYIAIHYTANPGATAMANRDYFENLASIFLHRRCPMRPIQGMWIHFP